MHPLCSCESLPLSASLPAGILSASLLFPLSGPLSFSSTFPAPRSASVASSSAVSLVFPSPHLSLPSTFSTESCCQMWSQWRAGQQRGNPELLVQPVTTVFLSSPHPSWSTTRGLKPTSPQGLSLQVNHRGWCWQIRLRVYGESCLMCKVQGLTF